MNARCIFQTVAPRSPNQRRIKVEWLILVLAIDHNDNFVCDPATMQTPSGKDCVEVVTTTEMEPFRLLTRYGLISPDDRWICWTGTPENERCVQRSINPKQR
jgi:hypothetical protein